MNGAAMPARRRLVLFDLDGTLIDSEPGITACLAHAFERIGAELPARDVLRSWIGPPFRQTFPSVLGDDEARIVAAIDHYRDRFEDVGWTEHAIYEGIPELIASIAGRGDALAVVTTKPESQARLIYDRLLAPDRTWIDRASTGTTAYLYDGEGNWNGVWELAFWNRRISSVVTLPDTPLPGPMPQRELAILLPGDVHLVVQRHDLHFSAQVHLVIAPGVGPILRGLPVLTHHNHGSLECGDTR